MTLYSVMRRSCQQHWLGATITTLRPLTLRWECWSAHTYSFVVEPMISHVLTASTTSARGHLAANSSVSGTSNHLHSETESEFDEIVNDNDCQIT